MSPWQEPPHQPDPAPDPAWLKWFVGATLAAFFIVDIVRGIAGFGWNW